MLVSSLLQSSTDAAGRSRWEWRTPECHSLPSLKRRMDLHAAMAARGAAGTMPFWWQSKGVAETIVEQVRSKNYCIVDGFLGAPAACELATEVRDCSRAGKLKEVATVGQGRMHTMGDTQRAALRGDRIGWFTGTEPCWRVMPAYLDLIDHLVGLLRQCSGPTGGVGKCLQRSRAMVACYPGAGARYAKHCDNACRDGDGSACNGRRLTAILYLNGDWKATDGGELLIYPPVELGADPATITDPAIGRIAPRANRLLLFYADVRVPHEVLASRADRYAVTLWYYDNDEVARVNGAQRRRGVS